MLVVLSRSCTCFAHNLLASTRTRYNQLITDCLDTSYEEVTSPQHSDEELWGSDEFESTDEDEGELMNVTVDDIQPDAEQPIPKLVGNQLYHARDTIGQSL